MYMKNIFSRFSIFFVIIIIIIIIIIISGRFSLITWCFMELKGLNNNLLGIHSQNEIRLKKLAFSPFYADLQFDAVFNEIDTNVQIHDGHE